MSRLLDSIAHRLGYTKAPSASAPRSPSDETGKSRYVAAVYQPGSKTARPPDNYKTALEFSTYHPMTFASINHIATAAMGVPLRVMELKPDKSQKSYTTKATCMHVRRQWCKRQWSTTMVKERSEWLQTKGLVAVDVDEDYPLRRLLDMVSPGSTWSYLIYQTLFDMVSAGNCYWELVGGAKYKQPSQLYRMQPDQVEVKPSERGPSGFVLHINGKDIDFDVDEVLHLRFPSPLSNVYGLPRTTPLRAALETEDERIEYGREFMRNRTQLDGLLVARDGAIMDEEHGKRMLDEFRKQHTGSKNAGKVSLLTDADYMELGHTPRDAEYLAMADRHDVEIGAVTGVPSALFKSKDVNRSNLEAAQSQFWSDTMVPDLMFVADMLNEFLCPRFGETVLVDFDLSGVKALHESEDALVARESIRHNDGITTIDEYREATGLDAWPKGAGQKVKRSPAYQYVLIGEEPEPPAETPDPEPPDDEPDEQPDEEQPTPGGEPEKQETASVQKAVRKVIEYGSEQHKALYKAWDDRVRPWERKLQAQVVEWLEGVRAEVQGKFEGSKGLKATIPDPAILFDIDEQGNLLWREVKGTVVQALTEEGARVIAQMDVAGLTFNPENPVVLNYLKTKELLVKTVSHGLHEELRGLVSDAVRNGRSIQAITEKLDERFIALEDWQARRIAQTEVVGGMNVGAYSAITQSGIAKHEWVATLDDRVRDTHVECMMQGPMPVGEKFANGLVHPGDPAGLPEETINCRCTIIAATEE